MIVMILVVSIETLIKYSIWHMLVYSLSLSLYCSSIVCALLVRGVPIIFEPTVVSYVFCLYFNFMHVCQRVLRSFIYTYRCFC